MEIGEPALSQALKASCDACVRGMQTWNISKIPRTPTSKPLEIIHSDIVGPVALSILQKRYFVTFIDDYSRHVWIYFMEQKSEIMKWFCIFQSLVERQTGHKILALQSDNGGEYLAHKF